MAKHLFSPNAIFINWLEMGHAARVKNTFISGVE